MWVTIESVKYLARSGNGVKVSELSVASVFADWRTSLTEVNSVAAWDLWVDLKPKILDGWVPTDANDPLLVESVAARRWRNPEPQAAS